MRLVRLIYGVAAMSISFAVFSFLQEREEEEERKASRISTERFFDYLQNTHLSTQQKVEIRKFWRNAIRKHAGNSHDLPIGDIERLAHDYGQVFPDIFPTEMVVKAARSAVKLRRKDFAQSTSSIFLLTGKRFHAIAKDTKGEVKLVVHRTVRRYLERALDVVADRLKHALKDEHMPKYLQVNIDVAVERLMPDVKMEIFRKTKDLLGREWQENMSDIDYIKQRKRTKLSCFMQVRAFILYHMFPFDKSIWKCVKNPWWILFTLIGILPVIGQTWWLFLFLIKDKTNEHQLCEFIIGFKAAQFVTFGVIYSTAGILSYISCIARNAMNSCGTDGPSLQTWNTFFFILQIALVWIAFFRLPYTSRPYESIHPFAYPSLDPLRSHAVYHDIFGNELHFNRGGYLMKLCGYETVCVCLIMTSALGVLFYPFESWQVKALFYWIRSAYGLLSFPFVIFKVPILASVLMHTKRMGYNEVGETVEVTKKEIKMDKIK